MKEMGILLHPDPKKVLSFELDDSDARKDKDLQDFLNNLEWCMP
jgi:hypothetical protein